MPYNYFFPIILGILPSIIWLAFYLKKDVHPEPKKWISLVFLLGVAMAPMTIAIERQAIDFFDFLNSSFPDIFGILFKNLVIVFIGMAAIEEFFKYLAVRFAMKKNPVFDEPADAMIYMIVSALGFAAVENVIVMYSLVPPSSFNLAQSISTLAIRSIGATFLHTLTSGIIGFYYALSLVRVSSHSKAHRRLLIIKGFFLAVFLHGAFNYFIIVLKDPMAIYFTIPLLFVAIYVMKEFKILQKISPKDFSNN